MPVMQQQQHEEEKFSGSTTIDMLLMHSDARLFGCSNHCWYLHTYL